MSAKIDNTQQNTKYKSCGDMDETVNNKNNRIQ